MDKDKKDSGGLRSEKSGDLVEAIKKRRRDFLKVGTALLGSIGGMFTAWPFIRTMSPSASARAAAVPVKVNITGLAPGQLVLEKWRGKPIWVVRRTKDMVSSLKTDESELLDPKSLHSEQPEYAKNRDRSIKPEFLVLVGICTHLGCSPTYRPERDSEDLGHNWPGGFLCACHGSRFDLAGRVFKNVPARKNLVVPPYKFTENGKEIIVGLSESKKEVS